MSAETLSLVSYSGVAYALVTKTNATKVLRALKAHAPRRVARMHHEADKSMEVTRCLHVEQVRKDLVL